MSKAWRSAVDLVARISVWLGMVLVVLGFTKATLLMIQSSRSLETLATIDAASVGGIGFGGLVDLSWQDATGATYRAAGVPVTYGLGRRLRLGSPLSRAQLRIKYQTQGARPTVLIVDDIPVRIRNSAALAIAGFLAITAGSGLILGMLLAGDSSQFARYRGTDPEN